MKELLLSLESLVRQAGAQILAEFYRPDGPRGWGDKADIDAEVEAQLSHQLRQLLPGSAVLGEELGASGPECAEFCWLLDPHDGTSAFLRGFRGSSVSVGLLHHNRPILGVVFAPLYPNDSGDLISGGPGLGLRRQGQEWTVRPQSGPLTPQDFVALSQDADQRSVANLLAVSPARYLAVPSIAYRLALAAVGDVRAAQSLMALNAHDVAAGHALLRAAGKELAPWAKEHDGPLRYTPAFPPTVVIGGDPDAIAELRQVAPGQLLQASRTAPLSPCPSARGWKARGLSLDRAQGVLMGQIAGDSLGSLVEFKTPQTIASLYPQGPRHLEDGGVWNTLAGQPTDDSELALALARQIVEDGAYQRAKVAQRYRDWLASAPFDVGRTTANALLGQVDPESQANGSLMRCSSLGLAFPSSQLETIAIEDSSLTHPHPLCGQCCRTFTQTISRGVEGLSREAALDLAWHEATPEVRQLLELAQAGPPDDLTAQMGWVKLAFVNAYAHLYRGATFEQALIETVRGGGDADTNAAIAGALLGAFGGLSAVPESWRLSVLTCRPAHELRHCLQPRPRAYWPVDLLNLAELLLEVRGR